ncbi:calcium-binding protein [Microvirga rosea]|uniref:calcium-binding protein n=1 Tax=Microvirga rosea TaxID=2715425 RepID=UPI001D0B0584|nr:calcium-binding protein [Microvirga rosea]MCB8820027.1 hypothetical protein [Microvirga rosea]
MTFTLAQEMEWLERTVLAGTPLANTTNTNTSDIGSRNSGDTGNRGQGYDWGHFFYYSTTRTYDENGNVIKETTIHESSTNDGTVETITPENGVTFYVENDGQIYYYDSQGVYSPARDDMISNPYFSVDTPKTGGTSGSDKIHEGAVFINLGNHQGLIIKTTVGSSGGDAISGKSWVYAEGGDDAVTGTTSADFLDGGIGNDTLRGNGGSDKLQGNAGQDWIAGESGDDLVDGGDGNDIVGGQDGQDMVSGGAGDDQVWGGAGYDVLTGDAGNDWIAGEAGYDTIDGGAGNDVVGGQDGADRVSGGAGQDQVWGGADDDWLWGDAGNDWIAGESGNDYVSGDAGDDVVGGQDGADTIVGGTGNDELWGGTGADKFLFTTALNGSSNVDTLKDFSAAEADRIYLEHDIFAALPLGFLSSYLFTTGAAASTADQHLIYHQNTGEVFYDADGSGAQAMVKFAQVAAGTYLTAYHFTTV